MDAAVYGLIGAGIGAGSTLITVWIQSHYLSKRERAKSVVEVAVRSREQDVNLATARLRSPSVPPLEVYVQHHHEIFALLEKNSLTAANLEKAYFNKDRMIRRLRERADERDADEAIQRAGG